MSITSNHRVLFSNVFIVLSLKVVDTFLYYNSPTYSIVGNISKEFVTLLPLFRDSSLLPIKQEGDRWARRSFFMFFPGSENRVN